MSESVHDHLDRNSVPDLERLRRLFLQIEEPRTSLKPQLTLTVSVTSQGICAARPPLGHEDREAQTPAAGIVLRVHQELSGQTGCLSRVVPSLECAYPGSPEL